MPGVGESMVTLVDNDNVIQHVGEKIVQSVHEVTTLPPPLPVVVAMDVTTTLVEPMVTSSSAAAGEVISEVINEVISEVTSSLASEVTTHAAVHTDDVHFTVESSTITVEQVASNIVENVVQPVVSEFQPLLEEVVKDVPQIVEQEIFTDTVTDRVTEFVTEATQEITTLLSTPDQHVDDHEPSMVKGDHSSTKTHMLTHDYVQWLHETRLILAISVSMVYLFTIFFVRRLLTKRSPFHLRNLLTLWNLAFSLFSVACSSFLVHSLIPLVKENGLGSAICSAPITDSTRFWLNLFTWCKLFELGNTLFVVLRKQKLRFIHVYYHLSTLIYTFHLFGGDTLSSGDNISTPGYYPAIVLINVTVQAIIYTYYTFRSRGFSPPKLLTMTLNLIHLIQFAAILFILSLSLYHHLSPSDHPIISTLSSIPLPSSFSKLTLPSSLGKLSLPPSLKSLTNLTTHCSPSMSTDIFGITIIGTNFILFVNHFRSNYVKPKTIKLL